MKYLEIETITTLTGEMLVLQVLGKCLFEYPEKSWFDQIASEALFAEIPFGQEHPDVSKASHMLSTWTEANQPNLSDETFERLVSDYTRLFIGPGKVMAPPWESVVLSQDHLTFQEQTLRVREWYRKFGLQTVRLYSEPDDHLGLELAFLSHLAQLALEASDRGDQTAYASYLQAQHDFLREHALKWVPLWTELVLQHAQTDFWRGIALLSRGVVFEMAALLEIELPRELR